MAARRYTFPVLIAFCLSGPAGADEGDPLSAIDWLSDSVEETVITEPATPEQSAKVPTGVSVLPLDAPVADTAGLIDAGEIGVDQGLWGQSPASDLSAALARVPDNPDAPPSLKRFLVQLMQARLAPPIDAAVDDGLFLARIDRLLSLGHLDAAEALLSQAGHGDPQLFRRSFDIAVLKGTETEACRLIEATPDLSPTYPTRIFCLARLGQWDVAALTLGNAETLGILSEDEDMLLQHFLDPELFEGEPIPPAPSRPSPIVFRLYEAVGERLPTDPLPVAFAVADLTETVGWKSRLRAAERLARTGAMPIDELLKVFAEREPAASGGVFDRVEAVMRLIDDLERGRDVSRSLPEAWEAARAGGFAPALAVWLGPRMQDAALTGGAAHAGLEIALLYDNAELARRFARDTETDRLLVAIATGGRSHQASGDPLGRAVLRGLSALRPNEEYRTLIREKRQGEALLRALERLSEGAAGNPDATAQSLALLRTIGLETLARRIAVELLLAEGAA